jgi:hypothetical protein
MQGAADDHAFLGRNGLSAGRSIAAFAQDVPDSGDFDGRWEGTVKFIPPEAYDADHGYSAAPASFAFSIDGKNVRVSYKTETGEWRDFQAPYGIATYKTNAVIISIHSNATQTNAGDWVETMSFTITHKDKDSLYIIFSRAVDNFRKPPDFNEEDAKGRFFGIAFGEFKRVPALPSQPAPEH